MATTSSARDPVRQPNPSAHARAINWLLAGDVAIEYQTRRDLLGQDRADLRARIAREGWGARLLRYRNTDGSWGMGFYQPKWTSSHYALLDLRALAISPRNREIRRSVHKIALENKGPDGGINPNRGNIVNADVCVNGMFLNYACYFGEPETQLQSVVDFLLEERMGDGGFNCRRARFGARHSSLHSTLSVIEGIAEYRRNGYSYRLKELEAAAATSHEFLLQHRLFRSHRTGQIIHPDMLKLAFPPRWKYNILRTLDYFRSVGEPWDDRMQDALDVLLRKRRADGRWPLPSAHPGAVHFVMERPGRASRWNTLLAMRVLQAYPPAN